MSKASRTSLLPTRATKKRVELWKLSKLYQKCRKVDWRETSANIDCIIKITLDDVRIFGQQKRWKTMYISIHTVDMSQDSENPQSPPNKAEAQVATKATEEIWNDHAWARRVGLYRFIPGMQLKDVQLHLISIYINIFIFRCTVPVNVYIYNIWSCDAM